MFYPFTRILGNCWFEIELEDDESSIGGISREGETLGDFCEENDIFPNNTTIGELQAKLRECGIREIRKGTTITEDIIANKIYEIEKELGVHIIDYRWDYDYKR